MVAASMLIDRCVQLDRQTKKYPFHGIVAAMTPRYVWPMRTMDMTTTGRRTGREVKQNERLLKLSLFVAVCLMAILLALCMSNQTN